MSQFLGEVRLEVARLHDLFAGWFHGTIGQDEFEKSVAARLHQKFENVQPSGRVLSRENLLGSVRNAWGSNPDFRIEVREARILGAWPDSSLILAGYVEAQFGARNTSPPDNLCRSTVLFERNASGLIWRYVHETAMLV